MNQLVTKRPSASVVQNPVYNNFSISIEPKPGIDANHQNSHSTALNNPEYLNTSLSPFPNTVFDSSPYWDQTANHQINLDNPDYQHDFLPKESKPNGISKSPAAENPEYLRVATPKSEYIEASAWPLKETSCCSCSKVRNAGDSGCYRNKCGQIKEQPWQFFVQVCLLISPSMFLTSLTFILKMQDGGGHPASK